jgi:hypothetical protein
MEVGIKELLQVYSLSVHEDIDTVVPADTVAPSVSAFIPADEATVWRSPATSSSPSTNPSFVATATSSLNPERVSSSPPTMQRPAASLSISGSTLTLNPSADLAFSTGYTVEFAAGSVKDLAGNSFAGSTSNNFTTASSPTPPPLTA